MIDSYPGHDIILSTKYNPFHLKMGVFKETNTFIWDF